jgi:zinc protease
MNEYTDVVSGQSTVKDLETMFQLAYLTFTDIRKDEKSYGQLMSQLETMLKNQGLTPEAAFSDSVEYTLNNHDWRSKPFHVEDLQSVNYDRVLQIAKERTANAANYTFFFVGNFDEAVIRPLIEQYIASLPGKRGNLSNWQNFDTHPEGQTINHFTRKMETPKANARIYWYDTKTPYSLENSIKADMLGQVLSKIYLQKIREDASAAYSAGASGYATINGDRPFTAIVASCPMKPEMSDVALKIMNEEIVEACKSIDATTLKEIKELMLKDHATELKENGYWMSTLISYVGRGIDDHTGYEQIVNAQTPETIAAFAKQILAAGNKVEVVMLPEE